MNSYFRVYEGSFVGDCRGGEIKGYKGVHI